MSAIGALKIKHKAEIAELQANCQHTMRAHVIATLYEKRTECSNCGKIIKRERS